MRMIIFHVTFGFIHSSRRYRSAVHNAYYLYINWEDGCSSCPDFETAMLNEMKSIDVADQLIWGGVNSSRWSAHRDVVSTQVIDRLFSRWCQLKSAHHEMVSLKSLIGSLRGGVNSSHPDLVSTQVTERLIVQWCQLKRMW